MERLTVPDDRAPLQEWLVYLMHEASYRWADPHVRGGRVLDLGCGTGYGTASLVGVASDVVGVDVSGEAIEIATEAFGTSGAEFRRVADPSRNTLPFGDASFDAVLSFQVIEHLDRPGAYLAEAARVLVPGASCCWRPPTARRGSPRGRSPGTASTSRSSTAAGCSACSTRSSRAARCSA